MNVWTEFWNAGRVFKAAFAEQQTAIHAIYDNADQMLQVPPNTPDEYLVSMQPVPNEYYTLRKNIFSTLFQSMYHLMDCDPEHRLFYGKLIHLFRIWVTSADNLLDDEDKVVIPIQMPGSSRVMRQVVSIMATDRVFQKLLWEGIAQNALTPHQAQQLSERSLQILLPSAAQEASEEEGVTERPDPETVLSVIHRYKTGILFNVAFLAPEIIEPHLDRKRAAALKTALLQFGIGCQVLDDIRDMARDYLEQRHNYLLSTLWKKQPKFFQTLENRELAVTDRLYLDVLPTALPTAQLGFSMMRDGLQTLGEMGLGISRKTAGSLAESMFAVLDLKDLEYA
ncbi:hypothetical protein [Tichowtungia aerotolerans]|uniref:Uncharacterized protein n=1 Tax=Tichowtungia aerotolerans TaxID=2697043 RepID=A0A6P1MET9_9BACT|nr:hypothetical protein [Tichowtungia aerotolerans]QHI69595.1 hypothetical protein GT409_09040 [Tichowtungia aerotolerans]